jgi:hypothetical protein
MQQTLEETLARFDDVQAQTATIEEEVVDEVCLFTQASNIRSAWGTSASYAEQVSTQYTTRWNRNL